MSKNVFRIAFACMALLGGVWGFASDRNPAVALGLSVFTAILILGYLVSRRNVKIKHDERDKSGASANGSGRLA